jgi:hypothetical protein
VREESSVLGVLAKQLRKRKYKFQLSRVYPSVPPPVVIENFGSCWLGIREMVYLGFLPNSVDQFQDWLKSNKDSSHLICICDVVCRYIRNSARNTISRRLGNKYDRAREAEETFDDLNVTFYNTSDAKNERKL